MNSSKNNIDGVRRTWHNVLARWDYLLSYDKIVGLVIIAVCHKTQSCHHKLVLGHSVSIGILSFKQFLQNYFLTFQLPLKFFKKSKTLL